MTVRFQNTLHFMLGRGVLMNPFLPAQIKNTPFTDTEKRSKLIEFHALLLDAYLDTMDNPGNALNKMKQFWIYFCHNFTQSKKGLKIIGKAKNLQTYQPAANEILRGNLN